MKMVIKTLKDLKQEVNKHFEKIKLFFVYQDKIDKLKKKYYKGRSALQTDLEEVGKLEEYKSLKEKQDLLLKELKLSREYEDFGGETFIHITSILNFIKHLKRRMFKNDSLE